MSLSENTGKRKILFLASLLVLSISFSLQIFASPKLSKDIINIRVGNVAVLKVTGTKKTVKWKTSNKKVAQIVYSEDNKVVIRALKKGNARITAKVGKKTLTCRISVKKAVAFPSTKTIMVGDTFKLKLTRSGKWKLSKKGIAQISKTRGKTVGFLMCTQRDN